MVVAYSISFVFSVLYLIASKLSHKNDETDGNLIAGIMATVMSSLLLIFTIF